MRNKISDRNDRIAAGTGLKESSDTIHKKKLSLRKPVKLHIGRKVVVFLIHQGILDKATSAHKDAKD